MSDYDDLTIHDVMSDAELAEEERDAELRLDAADEERALEAEQEADRAAGADAPDDCGGEFIDGTWYGCGECEACKGRAEDPLDVAEELDGSWI
ncbi:hypothetical protein [Streptomyces sp. NPDC091215]|uniref:hypothetical protein n=1 Tax=Streptomyces sp. NPDC091215 TaxID=3155192 RepID=UPI00342695DC